MKQILRQIQESVTPVTSCCLQSLHYRWRSNKCLLIFVFKNIYLHFSEIWINEIMFPMFLTVKKSKDQTQQWPHLISWRLTLIQKLFSDSSERDVLARYWTLCEYFASHFATQHQNRICFHEQLHRFPYFPVEGSRSPRAGPCYQMQIIVFFWIQKTLFLWMQ